MWLTDGSISKSFLCHIIASSCILPIRVLCPHGTSAKPASVATMHTSQQSSEVVAAAAVAESDAPEVGAAGTASDMLFSSSSSLLLLLLLLSTRGCGDSVWAATEWLTARRNCRRQQAPLSNRNKQDLIRLSFSTFDFFLGRRKFNPLRSV